MFKELSIKGSFGFQESAFRAFMSSVKEASPEGSKCCQMNGSRTLFRNSPRAVTRMLQELSQECSKSCHWNAPSAVTGMLQELSLVWMECI